MSTDTIEREIAIAAPIDRVWSLITQAEHLGTWFGDAGADIDLRPGGALTIRWDEYDTLTGQVEAVEPTSRFAFRWRQVDVPADAVLGEGNSTLVEFLLAHDGGTTHVRLVESGFDSLTMPGDRRTALRADHSEGWPQVIGDLAKHAETVAA